MARPSETSYGTQLVCFTLDANECEVFALQAISLTILSWAEHSGMNVATKKVDTTNRIVKENRSEKEKSKQIHFV